MKTLIIVPAFNEKECIKRVIESIYEANKKVDVLVVNDGSTDSTSQKIKETKAICIDLPINLGIGGAVQTGYIFLVIFIIHLSKVVSKQNKAIIRLTQKLAILEENNKNNIKNNWNFKYYMIQCEIR